ncbi:hypothetical protein LXL04_031295 [Taraxacum kok-saghyz]
MGESREGSVAAMKTMEEGQNHPENVHKRISIEEPTEREDEISALPDCILVEILSRLPFSKDAIRTGTLSKRWEHLWTLVPTLIFKLSNQPYSRRIENPNTISESAKLVDRTLTQCRQVKLKKFKVQTIYHTQFESQYFNWIRHAINCYVEELALDFQYPGPQADLRLDQSNFFINSWFTDLRLTCFTLNPSGAISWKNLKSFCISSQNLDEHLIINILSGSPLLENLELEYYYEIKGYDDEMEAPYNSQWPQLKHLKKFKVSAVCHNLFISQVKSWIRYVIKCNVKDICISLWLGEGSESELPIDEIIFTSSCVTDLRLDRCMINPIGAISWKNLTSLHISDCCLNEVMIENILSGSPILETLVLNGCFGYTRLDITSNSVKNLVLSGSMGSFNDSELKDAIEINAPNILSLTIQHQFKEFFMEVEQEILKNYIKNLGHVKELRIGDLCYEALSRLRDKGFVFPSNVKFPRELNGQLSFVQFFMGESREGSVADMKTIDEGQNHPKNSHKRIKIEEATEREDEISGLPDCILLEILSRLPFTKDAIRTGTLSKRWEHLWTLVPTLIFKLSNPPNSQRIKDPNIISDFAKLVDRTLTQCRQLKLKKFKVETIYHTQFESQYFKWINHAINCNVEALDLDFQYPGHQADLRLDQSNFFINSCFTDLKLSCFTLNPSGVISWKNLRSLCIASQNLNEHLIINILSGSPLLENLELEYYYEIKGYDDEMEAPYTSQWPQLKHLKKFKVSAVCHNLFISQVKSWIRYVIKCNVKDICISLWMDQESEHELPIDEIIFTSSCVTDLRLDRCMINPIGAITWKNLKSLHISKGYFNEYIIENILSGSPVLETLVLDGCCGYTRLDITSNSVKNLVLSGPTDLRDDYEKDDAIEINAPNILSLTIQNEMIMRKLLLVNVSSLVKANLNYKCTCIWLGRKTMPMKIEEEMLEIHIKNLGHVKELEIGDLCDQALSCLRDKGFVLPSNERKQAFQKEWHFLYVVISNLAFMRVPLLLLLVEIIKRELKVSISELAMRIEFCTIFLWRKAARALFADMKTMEEGQNHPKNAHKRIRIEEPTETQGIISGLPDCILLEILSRLPFTKDAIRTGTLSKRWEHLWTLVPTLSFKLSNPPNFRRIEDPNTISESAKLVDQFLTRCSQMKLKKFKVETIYYRQFESQYFNWIRQAINCHVEELHMDFHHPRMEGSEADIRPLLENLELEYYYEMTSESDNEFEAPYTSQWPELKLLKKFKVSAGSEYGIPIDEIIFTSSCVTDLRLDRCMMNSIGAISWKNLTSLHISDGFLDDNVIENILSGSPALETLVLDGCFGYTRLDITSNSVKNLVLSGPTNFHDDYEKDDAIEINAPNILSLTIQQEMIRRKLLLVNVSSLVKANLNYKCTSIWLQRKTMPMEMEEEMLEIHIMNLGHVKEIKIGDLCYKALSSLRDKGFVFPSNVKFPDHLTIDDALNPWIAI